MKIDVRTRGEVVILTPQGDIRVGSGDIALREALKSQLEQGNRNVVLDMHSVRFIDSAGLGELVASLKRVKEAGGDLKIARVTQRVSDALTVTQLVRVLDIYHDETEAVASFV